MTLRFPLAQRCRITAAFAFCIVLTVAVPSNLAQTGDTFAWEYSTPEEQGVDSAQLARMFAQIQRDRMNLHGFVLGRHDRIIAEAYVYPYTASTRHPLYSVSKSFTSSLVGIAIGQGLISGVDESVVDLFSNVTSQPLAERMSRMRLRHLLTMATGQATDTTSRITVTTNWEKTFMELPVEEEPGSRFVYNSGASYMLASAVQRRAGISAATFAQRHLFGPLGITDYTWDTSPTNVIAGGWGLSLRPLDMARFGLMYLHGGRWNGEQVVPANWVAEASRKQMENGTSGFWGSGYGYQFWINDFGGFRADGALGQYIFILPQSDVVAVFTDNLTSDTELPGRLMRLYVLPALASDPRPANPRANALLARVAEALATAPGAAVAPTFTALPDDQTVSAGNAVTFAVVAAGTPTPSVQWYKDELMLAGASSPSLVLANVGVAEAGQYVAVARNSAGATASFPVTLTVHAAPSILTPPIPLAVSEGGEAMFRVRVGGDSLAYAWTKDGVTIPGADQNVLRIAAVGASDAGQFQVAVTNDRGRVSSAPVRLTIGTADHRARLVNLAVRSVAGAGDRTLIVGLVIAGADRSLGLPVLLRGIGPSLASLEVSGVLTDPAVVLFDRQRPIRTNADWGGDPILAATMKRVGAFALPRLGADAALEVVLTPQPYTMHLVSSLPDRTGVAMVECYDASGGTTPDGPRLANVSARAYVGTGDETLIGGFVIAGAGTQRVLIRGIGPSLAAQGVAGVLGDPSLTLFAGQRAIATNDDWSGDPALQAAFVETGAFNLAENSKDAALMAVLPAGVYTTHVTGPVGTTGVALVEIYAVP